MSEPSFLTVAQVERLHEKLINRFGGSPGLRDRVLFESAVIQPRNVYYYGQGDLFDIAAAYAFHISEAQAFLDGNKRTGMAAALIFLQGNGIAIPSKTDRLYEAIISVAEKQIGKIQLAALLRELAVRPEDS
jgi:death on curing protein